MSLLNDYGQKFNIMNKSRVSDGEGGFITEWTEGAEITMAQAHNTTVEAQEGERAGTVSTYTFLYDKSLSFDYHDVVKRQGDGQVFRITQPSGEDFTPAMSKLNLGKVTAEKWELTT